MSRWIVTVDDLVSTQGIIDAPPPFFKRCDLVSELPADVSGDWVYFGWIGGEVVYVGMTSRLRTRLGTSNHQALTDEMMVSFISCKDRREAFYMECYFVWRYKPILNKIPNENISKADENQIGDFKQDISASNTGEQLLSIKDVSIRWNCGMGVVCRMIRSDGVPITYVGKKLMVSMKTIKDYEDRLATKPRTGKR